MLQPAPSAVAPAFRAGRVSAGKATVSTVLISWWRSWRTSVGRLRRRILVRSVPGNLPVCQQCLLLNGHRLHCCELDAL
jgi:hypothetical protein